MREARSQCGDCPSRHLLWHLVVRSTGAPDCALLLSCWSRYSNIQQHIMLHYFRAGVRRSLLIFATGLPKHRVVVRSKLLTVYELSQYALNCRGLADMMQEKGRLSSHGTPTHWMAVEVC